MASHCNAIVCARGVADRSNRVQIRLLRMAPSDGQFSGLFQAERIIVAASLLGGRVGDFGRAPCGRHLSLIGCHRRTWTPRIGCRADGGWLISLPLTYGIRYHWPLRVVFAFPGIGELALVAMNARDYPLVQGITIVTASIFVIVNLLVDLAYAAIDPRIRMDKS